MRSESDRVLVPRLQPRNTLPRRLLPPARISGGRSRQCVAFQGWSPETRIDSLIPDRANYIITRRITGGKQFRTLYRVFSCFKV